MTMQLIKITLHENAQIFTKLVVITGIRRSEPGSHKLTSEPRTHWASCNYVAGN